MTTLAVIIPARNEEERIGLVLKALQRQSLKPDVVVVVDDGSTDRTPEIAEKLGAVVVRNPIRHEESWVDKPEFAYVHNLGLAEVYRYNPEFFAIVDADTVLARNYFEKVIEVMRRDFRIVAASGVAVSEPCYMPRNTGRVYRTSWFRRHVGFFPLCYMWEVYPVFKALALGYRVCVVCEAKMWLLRKTKLYKPCYGYAMRELGYPLWYVAARALVAMARGYVTTGIRMLSEYLSSAVSTKAEPEISRFIKLYTARRVLGMKT
jgi:glycosyltransferase involved in cell wall biosynthesis